jgi:hypothetical protein
VGTVERNMKEIKEENLIRWSFQFVDQILEEAMRCVSLHTEIRRRYKWKNDTRVLLDSEIR